MARAFTATTHNLRNASVPAVASTGSAFIRIKPNWAHNDSVGHFFWMYGTTAGHGYPHFLKYSDNNVYAGFWTGTDQRIIVAATAAMFTNGTWANHIFTWTDAGDDQKYYVDNVQLGSRTTTLTIAAPQGQLTVGNDSSDAYNTNSELAEYGMWNRVLDAAERAVLQATGCPLSVPQGLVSYYPIMGRFSPEIGLRSGIGLTVTDATQAAHPRVSYPSPRRYFAPSSLTLYQTRYRWRNDDGDEDAATWAAAESTAHTIAKQTPVRLRVQVDTTGDAPAGQVGLQYSTDPGGPWTDVGPA